MSLTKTLRAALAGALTLVIVATALASSPFVPGKPSVGQHKPAAISAGISAPLPPTTLTPVFTGRAASQLPVMGASIKQNRGFNPAYPVTPAQQVALAQNLRLTSLRVDVDWGGVEATQGVYNWSNYDGVINALVAAGIRPILIVGQSNPAYGGLPTDNTKRAAFGEFVMRVANRYGVLSPQPMLEIWNEPNNAYSNFTPAQFGTLLVVVSDYVRNFADAGVRNIFMVTGGPSTGNTTTTPGGDPPFTVGMITWVRSILDQIGPTNAARFNALGWHPYVYAENTTPEATSGANPPATAPAGSGWYADIKAMNTEYVGYGYPLFPVYNTEQGTFLSQAGRAPGPGTAFEKQQKYIPRNHLAAIVQGIASFSAYNLVDDGTNTANDEQMFGLYDFNFNLKPGGQMVKSIMDALYDGNLVSYDYATAGDLRVIIANRTGGTKKYIAWSVGSTVSYVRAVGAPAVNVSEAGGVLVL